MPSFSHSVELSQPPEAVFPWLLEEDKVPQWTSDLQSYSVEGQLGQGAQVRQSLNLAGGLRVTMEIVRYDPPRGAETRFETNGVKVTSAYVLEANGVGTRLTQTLEAKASGLTGRMLIPVVQGRLEQKLTADLERLRGVLEG
ncbi:SRPBCC family protein [Solirubrobacter soli]|uniref:SRPBCC family protein n=1 Tax=Solirubrobacter soli TaxID=363832 RepID=UPI000419C944|nr:SRPBCC family protein [Solirubrobacter soli]